LERRRKDRKPNLREERKKVLQLSMRKREKRKSETQKGKKTTHQKKIAELKPYFSHKGKKKKGGGRAGEEGDSK